MEKKMEATEKYIGRLYSILGGIWDSNHTILAF